ncbi:Vps51/Vps67 family (components of vesicular transport) protein [Actinidia rufa]|uniref:Vps51/Vps67 family (Components of vesicular transport) protein n=1 Tax=Actinidia rufa TaxID=165716 RepID=A0A7J0GSK2_9ERIC|nr:Vps51/Vps67 family (components of vesicular transport) protein [Actinidia rufa]
MEVEDAPLDDKAKRMRDLLSSFYSADPPPSMPANASSKYATLDTINTTSFDADQYMNLLVQKSNLEGLLQRHVEMAAEIKNLDTDLQMLVYENYNKFISATETIKRMKNNIVGMESNMEQLLEKIMSVQSRSDGVNTSLFEQREHIEKLHRTRNLLRKVQFIYDLPSRLGKCIKSEAYADAVRFYTGAMPIFKAYGDSSFQDCKRASEEAVAIIIRNLQGKLFSDSESIQARNEAAMLLKQLDFPVDSLKAKLLEKLEQFLDNLQLESGDISNASVDHDEPSKQGKFPVSVPSAAHEASTHEFVEAIRAYRIIFPDSEQQLIKLAQDLVTKQFKATQEQIKRQIRSADLLEMLRVIWTDVLLMDEVLPEAALSDFSLEAARVAVKQYIDTTFSHLLHNVSDALTKVQCRPKEGVEEEYSLQSSLEASKKAVTEGSTDVLQDFRQLLDDNTGLLVKLRDLIIDWVQEGFQDFFRKLDDHFLLLSGKTNSTGQDQGLTEGTQKDKVLSGLVLVLAQLSVFIEQSGIPRITEASDSLVFKNSIEIAASFSGGGVRGYEYGPAFVPAEICRIFRSAGEKFLHLRGLRDPFNSGDPDCKVILEPSIEQPQTPPAIVIPLVQKLPCVLLAAWPNSKTISWAAQGPSIESSLKVTPTTLEVIFMASPYLLISTKRAPLSHNWQLQQLSRMGAGLGSLNQDQRRHETALSYYLLYLHHSSAIEVLSSSQKAVSHLLGPPSPTIYSTGEEWCPLHMAPSRKTDQKDDITVSQDFATATQVNRRIMGASVAWRLEKKGLPSAVSTTPTCWPAVYIKVRTQKISVLSRKRFTTPNWVKHKEPREVHMFVDLFLQELEAIGTEVKQILPQGLHRNHRRTDSNGSTNSSRSNPLRDDKILRSNTQRARSQLLETHLAKLFKQKMEIFTKVEHTQESVVTTIVKLCLKSLQEFVRLQAFNRSGFQQIQLDIQFLRTTLKETVEDEAAIDFLLDEVIVAAAERCLDPIPLEPPILDKLIQAKLAKTTEQSPSSS